MEGWVGLLDRLGGLFGETCVALPTIFDKAGDPEARANKLEGDRRQWKVMGKTMTPAEKRISCPPGPVISRAEDSIETRAFPVLDNVGEALIALTAFTRRLEQVLQLRGFHVLRATSDFGGKDSVELFALGQGP